MAVLERYKNLRLCVGFVSPHVAYGPDKRVGLIPSRGQVNGKTGYSGVKTQDMRINYSYSGLQVLERDHAGLKSDTWRDELAHDACVFDMIHVDPWQTHADIVSAAYATAAMIRFCERKRDPRHSPLWYEVGTEQGVRPYTVDELDRFLDLLKRELDKQCFERIAFAVVQTGTNVFNLTNTANEMPTDETRLLTRSMTRVCHKYGMLAKEHSSDFMTNIGFLIRRDEGVDCFNIAPELGTLQTRVISSLLIEHGFDSMLRDLIQHVVTDSKYHRWISHNKSSHEKFEAAGHYYLNVANKPGAVLLSDNLSRALASVSVDWQKRCEEAIYQRKQELLCLLGDR